jgi:adenine phosphoribosyltransferase
MQRNQTPDVTSTEPEQNKIASVGFFELMKLYCSSASFADAVNELEQRYHTTDFEVNLASFPLMYILQSNQHVKTVLTGNTRTGYHNNNFDVAHGHSLNINATQAFNGSADMTHNPLWKNIHKGLLHSVGDKQTVTKLLDKHIHKLFSHKQFTLDKQLEKCLLGFWCEYMFGPNVDVKEFRKTREKLLHAMRYAFYGNTLKNTPVLGELTCRFYGWLKGNEFQEVDDELRGFLGQADSGLLNKLKIALQASADFPAELVDQVLLDNSFDFILVFDFINNALYETMASIIKNKINDDQARRENFAPGLRSAFLFPYRVRVPQQTIQLNDKTIAAGSYVYVNLVKSGLYHSYGPRACVGTSVTQWIKDRFFDHLQDIEFNIEKTSTPHDRETPLGADMPMSPERYEVSWNYPRDYLQKNLRSYHFKNVEHFYDVLNAYENPRLFGYAVSAFVEVIEKLNIDKTNLVIASPEMRGIPLAAAVAHELKAKQIYIRKPGKIPGPVLSREYQNAYSAECLEISQNAGLHGKQVILLDDGIASGGTTKTCCELIEASGGKVAGILAMIDHHYKAKIAALDDYQDRIHTLFDFEASLPVAASLKMTGTGC